MNKYQSLAIKIIKVITRELLFLSISLISIFAKQDKKLWFFCLNSGSNFGGNIRMMVENILCSKEQIKPVICTQNKKTFLEIKQIYAQEIADKRLDVVCKYSIGFFYNYIKCCFCFVTHSRGDIFSTYFPCLGKIIINLWHGNPIKTIGNLEKSTNKKFKSRNFLYQRSDFFISTSKIDLLAMSSAMAKNPSKIWITGLPRNDIFYLSNKNFPQDLRDDEKRLKTQLNNRKLILYAPTFRENGLNSLNPLYEDAFLEKVINIAREYNAVIGIRPHNVDKTKFPLDYKNIIDCSSYNFYETQIVLKNTDLLITDYSGIWVDFLVVNKPILGFCYDYNQYSQYRDFIYNFEKTFPGKISYNLEELLNDLENILKNGESEESKFLRQKAFDIFHHFNDGNSSQRVIEEVQKLIKN